ncbi:substrate-binding domain-containing protein [Neobacillus sp. NPDC097160]|uniref:substrate-binding domain-containing protein n=1 Tax=Neobacillus sp. NPDC097160 TaxID=3364298 RepID=UPI0038289FFC
MKKSRLVFLSFLIGCMLIIASACGNKQEASSGKVESGNGGKKIVIGVTNTTLKSPVYQIMKEKAEKKAKELGAEVIWQSAENDPATQANQVQNFIAQGVSVIVIEPADANTSKEQVARAKQAKIPVINLEDLIMGTTTDLRIVADSEKVGEMQVDSFLKEWGDKPANVIVISGAKGNEGAETITKGEFNIINQHKNLKVVANQYIANWDTQLAMNMMENVLVKQNNDIQAVFANNDGMLTGALKAAKNNGVLNNILFYGGDNDQNIVEEIIKGTPVTTIDKGASLQGNRLAEAAVKLAKGEKPTYDKIVDGTPVWYTPISIVNKDNLDVAKEKYPELFK